MDYQLLKQLKDAGFEQGTTSSDTHFTYINEKGNPCHGIAANAVYIPTLSELITACVPAKADDFGLQMDGDRWHAWYSYSGYFEHNPKFKSIEDPEFYGVDLNVYGQTPEEAFAFLWLSLNKP